MRTPQDNLDLRIQKCRKILKSDPDSQIFGALADCYRKKGEFDEASRICLEGLSRHLEYGPGHLVMAKIHLALSDYDGAQDDLESARKFMGNTRAIEILECEILIFRYEFHRAESIMTRLKQVDPNNPALDNLALLLNDVKQSKATNTIEHQELILPDEKDGFINQGSEDADTIEDKNLSVESVINALGSFSGVNYVMAADYSGKTISYYSQDTRSSDDSIQLCTIISRGLNHCLPSVGLGTMGSCLIETEEYKYFLKDTGQFYIVFEASSEISFGLLNLKMTEMLARLDYR
ncbi:MAG: tetratricopeptide repeat protein [candidate division Zixibacteria bacterium]|nr:tetratricopeptide repeat protein [candidate division Zixibacteria bacterium]